MSVNSVYSNKTDIKKFYTSLVNRDLLYNFISKQKKNEKFQKHFDVLNKSPNVLPAIFGRSVSGFHYNTRYIAIKDCLSGEYYNEECWRNYPSPNKVVSSCTYDNSIYYINQNTNCIIEKNHIIVRSSDTIPEDSIQVIDFGHYSDDAQLHSSSNFLLLYWPTNYNLRLTIMELQGNFNLKSKVFALCIRNKPPFTFRQYDDNTYCLSPTDTSFHFLNTYSRNDCGLISGIKKNNKLIFLYPYASSNRMNYFILRHINVSNLYVKYKLEFIKNKTLK